MIFCFVTHAAQYRHSTPVSNTELVVDPTASAEHRLLQTILHNYDTDARGVDTNSTVTVSIQLLLLRIQGLVSSVGVFIRSSTK